MREIIIKGTDKYRTSCSECGCAFTYERGDVHYNYVRGGDWVSCPHCGHDVRHLGADGWKPRTGSLYRRLPIRAHMAPSRVCNGSGKLFNGGKCPGCYWCQREAG